MDGKINKDFVSEERQESYRKQLKSYIYQWWQKGDSAIPSSFYQILDGKIQEIVIFLLDENIKSNITSAGLIEVEQNQINNKEQNQTLSSEHYFQAASRIIMRLLFIFCAEDKRILPIDNSLYRNSYSLTQLFAYSVDAENEFGEEILSESVYAWRRIQALFRLVYEGIDNYEGLSLPAYRRAIFQQGTPNSEDPISHVLSIFENKDLIISDTKVLRILQRIKELL